MNFDLLRGRWLRYEDTYYYCRGTAPDGTPRVVEMGRPPHGKTVHVYNGTTGDWSTETLPFRLQNGAKAAFTLAAAALILVPLVLSGQDPILWKVCTPVAVGFFLLVAVLVQTSYLYPHDTISLAEADQATREAYIESQHEAAQRTAHQQAKNAAAAQQGQMAIWAQLAQINQAAHPDQDTYRPYGQSPPL
ncbi:hypothetical protein OG497_38060 [Streptomyces sp. NBC_01242]|uniref:hypothetical protein n=1 Tax=Streptomyces sp. NBC_01242 TaxID=2903795 RepID=UPI002255ECFE|nr:hypothetical protein [Streptomyces sp. NBC_01242]MCX4799665.1 hypothetical protein [Streptomyces sp. NBC_01242]